MKKALILLFVCVGLTVDAQDLSPWNASFVVYAGGYSDTIWVGCDTAGDHGYQEGLDILDTSAFNKPLKIIGYDAVIQEDFNTTTCGNLKRNIKSFKENRTTFLQYKSKNGFEIEFLFYVLIDTNIISVDTILDGDLVDTSLVLSWDSLNFLFNNDSFKLSSAHVIQLNSKIKLGMEAGNVRYNNIYNNFDTDIDPLMYVSKATLLPQEYVSECYNEYNKYDYISELKLYMRYNTYDTSFIFGLNTHNKRVIGKTYPNPNRGRFHIRLDNSINGQIFISDILGRMIFQKQINNKKETSVDLSNQHKGLYFLQIFNEQNELIGVKKVYINR